MGYFYKAYTCKQNKIHKVKQMGLFDKLGDVGALLDKGVEMAFNACDKNGDGKLDKTECLSKVKAVLAQQGIKEPSEDQINAAWSKIDKNGDGALTLDEFKAFTA